MASTKKIFTNKQDGFHYKKQFELNEIVFSATGFLFAVLFIVNKLSFEIGNDY